MMSIAPFPALLLAGVCAALFSAAILAVLLASGWAWRLATDVPNHRSMHQRPTPRVGGWGVTPAAAVVIVLFAHAAWPLAFGLVSLAVVSFLDDRYDLPARYRFAFHLLAAGLLIASPGIGAAQAVAPMPWTWPVPWLASTALVIAVVWVTNLYNFMDGADGLAGGMAVAGFAGYALIAWPAHPDLAVSSVAVAGAALGFLFFNFPPARLFLGDAGSIPLGFAAAACGYLGWRQGAWSWWLPIVLFAPFFLDASVTLLRRLARGEKVWQAHREHYYQRMMLMAASRRRVLLCWYALMLASLACAWFALRLMPPYGAGLAGLWLLVLIGLGGGVDRAWRRHMARMRIDESRKP